MLYWANGLSKLSDILRPFVGVFLFLLSWRKMIGYESLSIQQLIQISSTVLSWDYNIVQFSCISFLIVVMTMFSYCSDDDDDDVKKTKISWVLKDPPARPNIQAPPALPAAPAQHVSSVTKVTIPTNRACEQGSKLCCLLWKYSRTRHEHPTHDLWWQNSGLSPNIRFTELRQGNSHQHPLLNPRLVSEKDWLSEKMNDMGRLEPIIILETFPN